MDKWSDSKKWLMGILASIILGVLSWGGLQIVIKLNEEKIALLELVNPADGSTFSHFPRVLNLEWQAIPGASRYVIEIEAQSGGKWFPQPNKNRLVSSGTSQSVQFIGAQPGRWKVTAIGNKEKVLGTSPWWYFEFMN